MSIIRSLVVMAAALAACGSGTQAQTGLVKLDRVSASDYGLYGPSGILLSGNIHRAYVRFDLRDCAPGDWWSVNGFEVYSPDGADWGYLKGTDGPLVTELREKTEISDLHLIGDGSTWTHTGNVGEDSAACVVGSGLHGGYRLLIWNFVYGLEGGVDNNIALILEFTSRDIDIGRTICFDSMKYTSQGWSWGCTSTDYPRWDNGLGVSGPRCWEIQESPCSPGDPPRERVESSASDDCYFCCKMRVGNVDGSADAEPSLGDIMTMVDAKFVSGNCDVVACLDEADIDKSGGVRAICDDITLGDIMLLVDYLFITGPQNTTLPACY